MMDIKEFASRLNGNEYGEEMSLQDEEYAKQHGFVVVFAYSDDNMEFRGAISDEVGCYNGGNAYFDKNNMIDFTQYNHDCNECPLMKEKLSKAKTITAVWCGDKGYTWHYETDIPHETFEILEDGEKFCRGIVFDIKSLQ